MAIVGKLIKTAINISDLLSGDPEGNQSQLDILTHLLTKAKHTAFGATYDFEKILSSDDPEKAFSKHVPYFDYDSIYEQYWSRILAGEKNVTWPGIPEFMALSSGTTGSESKRIPVTNDMLEAIKKTGLQQIRSLSNIELPSSFFEKEILMLGSSTDLIQHGQFKEGEISGISASNLPFWFEGYYKPGKEIARINDWDDRVNSIAQEASSWDIGALSGIPSWIELMLKKVIEVNQLSTIHDIWPNLQVYTSGGVAFEPYRKSFDRLMGKPVIVLDTYLASEGFLAYQSQDQRMDMTLSLESGIYFEFVPFDPGYITDRGGVKKDAPSIPFAQTRDGEEYVLVISTVAGAWRYVIGDTVRITNKELAEIRITGRTRHFLNVVGSQLSVSKMNDAINSLENKFNCTIPEFTVSAVEVGEGEYSHHWYLGIDDKEELHPDELAGALDEFLKGVNKNYGVARSKALKSPTIMTVPIDTFYSFTEYQKKKGGQVKVKRVMDHGEHEEWVEFIETIQATTPRD